MSQFRFRPPRHILPNGKLTDHIPYPKLTNDLNFRMKKRKDLTSAVAADPIHYGKHTFSETAGLPKAVFPWPEDPPGGLQYSKWKSATWLNPRKNDGSGNMMYILENFHWKKNNAYDTNSLLDLQAHIRKLNTGNWPFAIVLRPAQKSKATLDFCPGADYRMIYKHKDYAQKFFKTAYETAYVMATSRKPLFTCISGRALGLGAGLSIHSLFRVANEDGVWGFPQTLIGAFPDCGSTWYLPRLRPGVGMYLALTGFSLRGYDIKAAGIATHFMLKSDLKQFYDETAIIKGVEPMKEFLNAWNNHSKALDVDSELEKRFFVIEELFDQPSLQEIFTALEKKQDIPWVRKILYRLKECSPLMLHVTFRLQKLGFYLKTLEEALNLEFRVALNMLDCDEFKRGIKARVIEKKNKTDWLYPDINSVPNSEVANFFKEHYYESELNFQPGFPGIVPSTDPFRIYFSEVENRITSSQEPLDWMYEQHVEDIIPTKYRSLQNIKRLYAMILNDSKIYKEVRDTAYYQDGELEVEIEEVEDEWKPPHEDEDKLEGANIFSSN